MFSHAFNVGFLDFVVPNLFLSSFYHSNQYWLSVHYEQSVRFQEKDHDDCRRLYFPYSCCSGTSYVFRSVIANGVMKDNDEHYPVYPVFKGLQRPLEFMGIQGRYIYWAAGTIGAAIVGFIIAYCIAGFILGLAVLAIAITIGAGLILFKQRKGLHSKRQDQGVFIYAHSKKM